MSMRFQDYNSAPGVKELLDNLKQSEDIALRKDAESTIAYYLYRFNGAITQDCYLVPVPQKSGKAEYTKDICNIISMFTGAKTLDIVKRVPGTKKFYRSNFVPSDAKFIIFVDDKISTGKTYEEVNDLFDQTLIPLVFAVDYSVLSDPSILENVIKESVSERHKYFHTPKEEYAI